MCWRKREWEPWSSVMRPECLSAERKGKQTLWLGDSCNIPSPGKKTTKKPSGAVYCWEQGIRQTGQSFFLLSAISAAVSQLRSPFVYLIILSYVNHFCILDFTALISDFSAHFSNPSNGDSSLNQSSKALVFIPGYKLVRNLISALPTPFSKLLMEILKSFWSRESPCGFSNQPYALLHETINNNNQHTLIVQLDKCVCVGGGR